MVNITKSVTISVSTLQRALWFAGLQRVNSHYASAFERALDDCSLQHEPSKLVQASIQQKCSPLLYSALRCLTRSFSENDVLELINRVYKIVDDLFYTALDPVIQACVSRGIPVMVIKGGGLALDDTLDLRPRIMYDLDILIRPPDTTGVREIFADLGYVQGRVNIGNLTVQPVSTAEMTVIEATHYELLPFLRIMRVPELDEFEKVIGRWLIGDPFSSFAVVHGEVYFVLAFDVHHNLSLDFDIGDIWNSPRRLRLPTGLFVDVQGITDQLWFLAARLYHEVMILNDGRLRGFFDICALLSHYSSQIEWDCLLSVASKYDLQPSLYYSLWHVNEVLDSAVPMRILESCSPCNTQVKRFHDWGDFLPKLLQGCACFPATLD
jgi:hypothetical protein